jgi:glycosyltransferase involved in cell wall biosynthesis
MGMKRGAFDPRPVFFLARRLRETQADIVHTWMYHADLVGGFAARGAGVRAIAWSIRNTNLDRDKTRLLTHLVVRVNALVSGWLPTSILSNSEVARDAHIALGYAQSKMTVIPNGFDLTRFKPDPGARASVRQELRLTPETPIVGIVGRFDPQKNHAGFLEAAGLLRRMRPEAHFLLVGPGLDECNDRLADVARRCGVADVTHWLGQREDIPRLMASFDVLASSSFGESFPNVLGEAMACGVPCAVTDVGDSASIVADTGRVVSPGDMPSLAAAINDLLALEATQRTSLGCRARARVEEHFEIGRIVRRFEDYYDQLALNAKRRA